MSGLNILEADQRNDVASLCAFDHVAVVSVHFHHAADALSLTCKGVEYRVTLVDPTGVDAGKGQGAEAVVHNLKGQGAERRIRINDGELASFVAFKIDLRLRLNFGWAW